MPNLHQAVSMVPNPDLEPNTVMDVFQKGYTLNGRLIRPAMVIVSKASLIIFGSEQKIRSALEFVQLAPTLENKNTNN